MAQLGNTIVNGVLRVIGGINAPVATTTSDGLMSKEDKDKLDNFFSKELEVMAYKIPQSYIS